MTTLADFLRQRRADEGLSFEAVLGLLPLVCQVLAAHADGWSRPGRLEHLHVDRHVLWSRRSNRGPPLLNVEALRRVATLARVEADAATPSTKGWPSARRSLRRGHVAVYLPGYVCWRHRLDHPRSLTDISAWPDFGEVAYGLDLGSSTCEHLSRIGGRWRVEADVPPVVPAWSSG